MDFSSTSTYNDLIYHSVDTITYLYNPIIDLNQTHILHEFFIPPLYEKQFICFIQKFFDSINFNDVFLLNITIRFVKKDDTTFLKYASQDVYAFVFYYRLNKTKLALSKLKYIHNVLTNKTLHLHGTFYFPYLCHYTYKQLLFAYPNILKFIQLKYKYDPNGLFSSKWFQYILHLTSIH